ncbi:Nucleotidyltransferase domain protein [Tepidimonas sediminis]|uniref:Nucleotidyltransferase domain protein n=1 Tax=Tepidimonas sediminis TaxID=2588941 RepID=A0A554WUU8_9BURK|nr:nucleotidyltransferase domain-containing protein [Tepidimonas sediminis]TSE27360.1 Nucleotidyltransferase domain protein [Tepidimonas sediminis]
MMLDLTPEQLDTVRRILDAHIPGRAVRVFGSRAAERAKPHSDLDLLIPGPPLDDQVRAALVAAFEESDLPFRVDLVQERDIPHSSRARLEQEAVTLIP